MAEKFVVNAVCNIPYMEQLAMDGHPESIILIT